MASFAPDAEESALTPTEIPPKPPSGTTPIVDHNGRMTREWFDYFAALRLYTLRTSTRPKEPVGAHQGCLSTRQPAHSTVV